MALTYICAKCCTEKNKALFYSTIRMISEHCCYYCGSTNKVGIEVEIDEHPFKDLGYEHEE